MHDFFLRGLQKFQIPKPVHFTQNSMEQKIRFFQPTHFKKTDPLFPILEHVKRRLYGKINTIRVKFTFFLTDKACSTGR